MKTGPATLKSNSPKGSCWDAVDFLVDGVKTQDIDAMVEELRNTHAQWYGDMTPERRAQILKEIFDVPPA